MSKICLITPQESSQASPAEKPKAATETKSQLTIAVAVDKPQRKIFTQDAKGVISSTSILPNSHWGSKTVRVNSLADLKKRISAHINMQNAAHFAVMRGEWLPDDVLLDMEKQRLEEIKGLADVPHHLTKEIIFKEGENPNLRKLRRGKLMREVPLHWVCFDFDGHEMEGVPFDVNNPSVAVDALIASELGQDFVGRSYLLQLSSSAGVPGKDGVRAHAWFWLKHGWTGAQWNAWYKQRKEALGRKPGFDKGMFQLERIHYIVDPVFKPEGLNPLLGKDRWSIVDGIIDDEVNLVPPEVVEDKTVVDYFNTDMVDEEEAQDAWTRPGVVGAFNRAYSMSETLQTFLSDKFEIVDNTGRVSWLEKPDAPGGLRIVAGNTKMFSKHNSDPRNGVVGNAFDVVETYMFDGDYGETADFVRGLPRVGAELERKAGADFDEIVEPAAGFVRKIDVEAVCEKTDVLTPEKVMADYPMPEKWRVGGRLQEACYRKVAAGWRYGYWKVAEETERKTFIELWSPISPISRDVSIQTGKISVPLRVMDATGNPIEIVVARGETVAKNILGNLWDVGWCADGKNGEGFVDFLRAQNFAKDTRCVSTQRGWFDVDAANGRKARVFFSPTGNVYAPDTVTSMLVLHPDQKLRNPTNGNLEGWKGAVKELCAIENVPHWHIAVAAGFTGPLMDLFGGLNGGIALGGDTSKSPSGKKLNRLNRM